ncbi:MAG: hypothetical protein HC875_34005 [Anaerolineales bacterium]|nr:hypothetical protein [Anaerolineales bacterium]
MTEPTPSSSATIGNVGDGIHGSNIAGRDVHVYYQMMAAAPTAEERLAAALKLLAGLPTEEIPAAGTLAAGRGWGWG